MQSKSRCCDEFFATSFALVLDFDPFSRRFQIFVIALVIIVFVFFDVVDADHITFAVGHIAICNLSIFLIVTTKEANVVERLKVKGKIWQRWIPKSVGVVLLRVGSRIRLRIGLRNHLNFVVGLWHQLSQNCFDNVPES